MCMSWRFLMRKQNVLLSSHGTVKVFIESSAKHRHISAAWPLLLSVIIYFVDWYLHFSLIHTGLVHVSEMSATRVEKASEIVDVGEQVWIKVIGREVTTHTHTHTHAVLCCASGVSRMTATLSAFPQTRGDKVKLSFSMKAVNQGTGRDMDPNNVMAE